ncbi:bifunctional epoxide hydrolase 2 [Gouania willdenowi]|uniref:AB hydrolase-1 domain-containing protein n=1 Tax=Gouania willdenowi TaxID=441366 RepID=A0A8C5D9C9_GOUWI|nr:bifunctional epoxide hydrolase 2 [Gouania willdenowi]
MADEKKAVVFNFWGVAIPSQPCDVLHKLEVLHSLPGGFLTTVASQDNGAMRQAERGAITLSQMIPVLEAECVKAAQVKGVTLPSDWSIKGLLETFDDSMLNVQGSVLKMAACLRANGILTAVLANHWVDDRPDGEASARLLSLLGAQFDLVLQSCRTGHRVPQPEMFSAALLQLGVTAQQAVWLDADEEGVRAAQTTGMKALLVKDLDSAWGKLVDVTGVKALEAECSPPWCSSDQVSHGYVSIKPGVRTHYVEKGCGPPVILCHGFPECWFSWRYQIPALAAAGFRVLALDMKGFGESTAPPDIEEYAQEQICKDLVTFLDKMAIPRVTLVGHDWGGNTVWTMAHCYPERVRAVASLNTPRFPSDPDVSPAQRIKDSSVFDYQVYFQNPGPAEAELEKDLERTFKILFSRGSEAGSHPHVSTAGVCARGGLFVGLPEEIPRSSMLTEAELQCYVSQYKVQGFRGPLNWYRNHVANWKWTCSRPCGKLLMPALMVTAGKDAVLVPALTIGMEKQIPNLTFKHIEESGHWTQMDKPAETNDILISWLKQIHSRA